MGCFLVDILDLLLLQNIFLLKNLAFPLSATGNGEVGGKYLSKMQTHVVPGKSGILYSNHSLCGQNVD